MPEPIPGMPTQEQIDSHRGYRMTTWKGHDNFECVKCQYATLWIEKMLKHLAAGKHVWAYPREESGVLSAPIESDKLEY